MPHSVENLSDGKEKQCSFAYQLSLHWRNRSHHLNTITSDKGDQWEPRLVHLPVSVSGHVLLDVSSTCSHRYDLLTDSRTTRPRSAVRIVLLGCRRLPAPECQYSAKRPRKTPWRIDMHGRASVSTSGPGEGWQASPMRPAIGRDSETPTFDRNDHDKPVQPLKVMRERLTIHYI